MTPQYRPGADLGRGCNEIIEQVEVARDCGFSVVLVGQHMVTGPQMQMLQVMPLMARLSAVSGDMLLGPGVLLLPMLHPVMVAEESATLDWLCGGNFVLAAGLGYRDEEFESMGTPKRYRVSRLEESLAVVRALWSNERVTHHGKHFQLNDVGASVRPKRKPNPPVWLGGDVEPAIRRAGRLADAWLGSPTASRERIGQQFGFFQDAWRDAGRGEPPKCPIIRECFVGKSQRQADEVSRGPLLFKYQAYAAWGHQDLKGINVESEFESLCAERFVVGDVAKAKDAVAQYADEMPISHLIFRVQWPGMEQADALDNIKRIGQVIR